MSKYAAEERRLAIAKSWLIMNQPFVGTLCLQIPHNVNPDLKSPYGQRPTAQTDGRTVEYHPDFMKELTQGELLFVCAHEIFHPLFQHTTRRSGRDPLLWNIAADYVINYHLKKEGIGTMPKCALYDEKLFLECDGVTERVYDKLYEEIEKNGGGGGGQGTPLDNCTENQSGDGASDSEIEASWKLAAASAAQAAKMAGKLSANMARLFDEIMTPKVDWRDVLQNFVVATRDDTRSYSRFSRRFISQGLYLPAKTGEMLGEMAFAIDCSGSVSAKDLAQFNAEITRVWTEHRPKKLHILYFDSDVCHYDEYDENNPFDRLTPHGSGGTAFSPIMRYLDKLNIEPVACIFLTDLYCNDFGPPPDYPVLWVTYGDTKAPWGQVVKM